MQGENEIAAEAGQDLNQRLIKTFLFPIDSAGNLCYHLSARTKSLQINAKGGDYDDENLYWSDVIYIACGLLNARLWLLFDAHPISGVFFIIQDAFTARSVDAPAGVLFVFRGKRPKYKS